MKDNYAILNNRDLKISDKINANMPNLDDLIRIAIRSGATSAAVIPTCKISVEEKLARLCREPKCKNFGLSISCPPYVAGPDEFRDLLRTRPIAIVTRIDLPSEILFSEQRAEVMRLLHTMVAEVERAAIKVGYPGSKAYAGSSCKKIFCRDHPDCRFLSEAGNCRHPDSARPSMSGYGINVSKLMDLAGWSSKIDVNPPPQNSSSTSWVAGLIIMG